MKFSFAKWVIRSSLQMVVLTYSQGILANDFMEFKDISSEQVTYETRVNNGKQQPYKDPYFHHESYLESDDDLSEPSFELVRNASAF